MATFGKSRRFEGNPPTTPPPGAYNPIYRTHTPAATLLGRGRDKNGVGHFDLTPRKCSTPARSLRTPSSLASAKTRRLSRSTPSLHSGAASSIVVSDTSGSSDSSLGVDNVNVVELERVVDPRASFRLKLEEENSRLTAENQRLRREKEEAEERNAQLAMEVKELRMENDFWKKIERERSAKLLPTPEIFSAADYRESNGRNRYGGFMGVVCAVIISLLKSV